MTGHPFAHPADEAGHVLHFEHTGPGFTREAKCTGCPWSAPAPGTGYARGRQLHTAAHADLLAGAA